MINSRRAAREATLQVIYQCDILDDWSEECVDSHFVHFYKIHDVSSKNYLFARKLCSGVLSNLDFIDLQISIASENWSMSRMLRVDRSIIRLAVFELAFCEDISANVTINEAIEIAKKFCGDESPKFVNGVLDRIAQHLHPNLEVNRGLLDLKSDVA